MAYGISCYLAHRSAPARFKELANSSYSSSGGQAIHSGHVQAVGEEFGDDLLARKLVTSGMEGKKNRGRNQGVMVGCLDMSFENVNALAWQVGNKNANTNIDKLIQINTNYRCTDADTESDRPNGPMA